MISKWLKGSTRIFVIMKKIEVSLISRYRTFFYMDMMSVDMFALCTRVHITATKETPDDF